MGKKERHKKSHKDYSLTEKIILATAILQLIEVLIEIIKVLVE